MKYVLATDASTINEHWAQERGTAARAAKYTYG